VLPESAACSMQGLQYEDRGLCYSGQACCNTLVRAQAIPVWRARIARMYLNCYSFEWLCCYINHCEACDSRRGRDRFGCQLVIWMLVYSDTTSDVGRCRGPGWCEERHIGDYTFAAAATSASNVWTASLRSDTNTDCGIISSYLCYSLSMT